LLLVNRRDFWSQYVLPFYHFRMRRKAEDGEIETKAGPRGLHQ